MPLATPASFTHLTWYTRRALRSYLVFSAMALIAALTGAGWLMQKAGKLEANAVDVHADIERLRIERASSYSAESEDTAPPSVQLERFVKSFPDDAILTKALQAAHLAAAETGVTLERGDYQLTATDGRQLGRYTLSIPVKGAYPAIQSFVGRMLEIPTLALDQATLSRTNTGENLVEASLMFTLFFHSDE